MSAWAVLRFAGAAWKSRLFFLRTLGPHGRCCALQERLGRAACFFCGLWVRMGGVAPAGAAWKSGFFFADFGSAWAVLRLQKRLGRAAFFLRTLGPHGRCCACRSGLEEPLFFICGPCVRMGVGGCRYAEAVLSSA